MQSIAAPSLQIKTKVFFLRCYYLGKGSCVHCKCTPAAAIILISPPATWGHCSDSFIIIFIILCTFVPTRELWDITSKAFLYEQTFCYTVMYSMSYTEFFLFLPLFFFCLSHFQRLPIFYPFFLSVITFSCIFLHSIPLIPLFLLTRSLFIIFPIIFLLTPLLFIPYSSSSSSPFHSYIHLYFYQSNLHSFSTRH